MRRCLIIAALLTLAASSASAQTVRLDQYQHPAEPKFKIFNQLYLKGAVDGLVAYMVTQNPSERAFCVPPNLAITVEQAEEIMLGYAEKRHLPGAVPVTVPLLGGLKDAFPCPKE